MRREELKGNDSKCHLLLTPSVRLNTKFKFEHQASLDAHNAGGLIKNSNA